MPARHRELAVETLAHFVAPHALVKGCADRPFLALLESTGTPSRAGRYAYLCTDPFWVFRSERHRCWSGPPADVRPCAREPLTELAQLLADFRGQSRTSDGSWRPGLPPFIGGAVGYLGYELLYLLEDIPDTSSDDIGLPDAYLLFFDLVIASDLLERKSFILATGFADSRDRAAAAARDRLRAGHRLVAGREPDDAYRARLAGYRERAAVARTRRARLRPSHLASRGIRAHATRAEYLSAIADIKDNIARGNVFEVCLTQRFDAVSASTGHALYDILRAVNPAPMSAYLRFPEAEVLSSSPERLLSLSRAGVVETRPIKGTRPRAADPDEDRALRAELAHSAKDRAENIMIVDLSRNDLGKVCRFGSVEVTELCALEAYPLTWQMVSTVRGHLRAGCDPVDLVRAAFPGGSMTGAPKIEAMKIIERLEPGKRGVYSGAIGFFDFDGALDLSIVIRTLVQTADVLAFHVGGAIVADSDPAEEYQETLDKANGLVMALDIAHDLATEAGSAGRHSARRPPS